MSPSEQVTVRITTDRADVAWVRFNTTVEEAMTLTRFVHEAANGGPDGETCFFSHYGILTLRLTQITGVEMAWPAAEVTPGVVSA